MTPINRRRLENFRANRRGYWSFWIFGVLLLASLFAELIANDRPLLVRYDGGFYTPVLVDYPETEFGGFLETGTDYGDPEVKALIEERGWILWPPIRYSYDTIVYDLPTPAPSPPTRRNWLGTDDQARDVTARLIYGFRISVLFGLILTLVSSVVGVAAGAVQGYFGGWLDLLFQRFIEMWSGLPTLYLLIILASVVTPSFWWLLGFMLLFSWMALVGVVRAEFLRARNLDYVRAARALGVGNPRIIARHVLPNAMVAALTFLPFITSGAVVTLTALDFLGFGLPPGSASLGELLKQGKDNLQAPWLGFTAFFVIAVMLSLLVFIGEAVRDAFDPRKTFAPEAAAYAGTAATAPGGAEGSDSGGRAGAGTALVALEDLAVRFGSGPGAVEAVDGVSLNIRRGETVALVGESGSGKSATALSILQLLPYPAASHPRGSIRFQGTELLGAAPETLQRIRGDRIAMIFQEPMTSLNPLHTIERQIGETLKLHKGLDGPAAVERTLELLRLVGIAEPERRLGAYPHELSGGQRQRVMIAMALANEPDLLIADEPTTALDVTIQAQLLALLMSLKQRLGMAILFITHDMGIVRKLADRLCVMQQGKIVEAGATDDVLERPQHPYTRHLLAATPKGVPDASGSAAEPLVACDDVKVWYPVKAGILRRTVDHVPGRGRHLRGVAGGPHRGRGGRERLGQDDAGNGAAAAGGQQRLGALRRPGDPGAAFPGASAAAAGHAGGVPGSLRLPEPASLGGPDHRGGPGCPRARTHPGGAGRAHRGGPAGGGAGTGGAAPLSPRVLRRPAAARRHRPGHGAETPVRGAGRAYLGPGRIGAGPDRGPPPKASGTAPVRLPVHQPRPQGGAGHEPPGAGGPPGCRGGAGPGRGHLRDAPARVHPGTGGGRLRHRDADPGPGGSGLRNARGRRLIP